MNEWNLNGNKIINLGHGAYSLLLLQVILSCRAIIAISFQVVMENQCLGIDKDPSIFREGYKTALNSSGGDVEMK